MDYRIMIFMTKDRLEAIDIESDGKPDTISMDGNEAMSYTSEEQIKEFCRHIKEFYNMDSFSDGRMEISILRFDATMKHAIDLLKIFEEEGVNECSLVSAEKVLPWIAMKMGLLKAGTAVQLNAFDLIYTVTLDNDRKLTCQRVRVGEVKPAIRVVTKEEFARYNHVSKKALFGDEEEKEAYEKMLKEKEREMAKLRVSHFGLVPQMQNQMYGYAPTMNGFMYNGTTNITTETEEDKKIEEAEKAAAGNATEVKNTFKAGI